MIDLILGGSGSGKSAYAESVAMQYGKPRFYVATMQVYGAEGRKKVERHRKLRAGKGFQTVECPMNVGEIVSSLPENAVVLLECMSNLVANEMFQDLGTMPACAVVRKILREIQELDTQVKHLVIVSNNVFEDGVEYDETTQNYIEALGRINTEIAKKASCVVEVVVGIPVSVKGDLPMRLSNGEIGK